MHIKSEDNGATGVPDRHVHKYRLTHASLNVNLSSPLKKVVGIHFMKLELYITWGSYTKASFNPIIYHSLVFSINKENLNITAPNLKLIHNA